MTDQPTQTTDQNETESMDHPRFSWRFRLLALATLSIALLVTAELTLRVLGIHKGGIIVMSDPHTGYTHIPNRTLVHESEGYAVVRINSLGFRDHETTIEKPANTFRIALIGDSFIEARQVALEDAVNERLESKLNKNADSTHYEVLNFGMNGFCTAQERLRLEHFVLPFDPDLVIVCITLTNDIRDNHPDLSNIPRPFYKLSDAGQLTLDTSFRDIKGGRRSLRDPDSKFWRSATWIASNVRLAGLATEALRVFTQRKRQTAPIPELADYYTGSERDLNIFRENPPAEWTEAWAITEQVFLDMRKLCNERNIPFVAVIQGSSQQICPAAREHFQKHASDLDVDYPEKRLAAFFATNNITYFSMAGPFFEHHKKTGEHLHGFRNMLGRGHWNEKGHELVAQLIHQFLIEQKLLGE